jgi:hypothetical protein
MNRFISSFVRNLTHRDTIIEFDKNHNNGEHILEDLPDNKLIEIASDFNIDIGTIELRLKKNN